MRALLGAALLFAAPAFAEEALAQDGRAVFERSCASCHAAEAGAAAGPGPNLHGVLGRRVGGDPGFEYSPVLSEAGRRGDVWDAARLETFLADPEEMYPGVWMGANRLRMAADRRAVTEWLAATAR